jgi:hypothetical protein
MKASSTDTSYEASYDTNDKIKLAKMEEDKKAAGGGNFLHNTKTNEILGRTMSAWMVAIYMLIFSACLSMFWGLCLWVFYQTLDNYTPKLQTTSSFIGANPGLGYRPMKQVCHQTDQNRHSCMHSI